MLAAAPGWHTSESAKRILFGARVGFGSHRGKSEVVTRFCHVRSPTVAMRSTALLLTLFGSAESISTRRALLRSGAAAAFTAVSPIAIPQPALADEDEIIPVYFGCGCFWHVQHEFVEAERKILGRKDGEITSRAGYAGGNAGQKNGKVCYHNAAMMSDYGSLGHAEVVAMNIPSKSFSAFAKEYFELFDGKGNRPDQMGDRGGEYRNLVGVPGGAKGPYASLLVDASKAVGDKLDFAVGKGDDADVRALAFVMDSAKFPFYAAEPYHQFHDGFAWGEDYPNSYNNLAKAFVKSGGVKDTGCPNGMLGVGIAGL